jgi:hypothetical protein
MMKVIKNVRVATPRLINTISENLFLKEIPFATEM